MLLRAADLLQLKPRVYEQRIRRDNLVSRLLRDALRRHQADQKGSDLGSLLGVARG